ncbi:hypothetical protein V6N13_038759 [Hibiscus sabdariffa]
MGRKLEHPCSNSHSRPSFFFHFLVCKANPFWVQLTYFIFLSLLGFAALSMSKPRTNTFWPDNIDVFFTSVSAATVSSMSTVEMEVFSDTQLIIMTVLMLVGGEVFTSMLGLQLAKSRFRKHESPGGDRRVNSMGHEIQLNTMSIANEKHGTDLESNMISSSNTKSLKYNATTCLGYVVLGYLLVVHVVGSGLVSVYVSMVPSAREILKTKGIKIQTFSFFTIVSTFSNCGFIPTNENMIVFKKNSGLLLMLIPQVLLGNTLYPACLRASIWVLDRMTNKVEFNYILKNHKEMGYGLDGLSWYQKLVGSLFTVVNSRHTGELIVDLSIVSSAILVLFVVMMYLPAYTSFIPPKYQKEESGKERVGESEAPRKSILECVLWSHLSYLAIFIILICITERHKLKEDPLNFNVLNITIEVVSAYGNVGFSTGYSCKRRVKGEMGCTDTWAGFVGRWSNTGKFILILVMFFGRLKSFSFKSGEAWKLS